MKNLVSALEVIKGKELNLDEKLKISLVKKELNKIGYDTNDLTINELRIGPFSLMVKAYRAIISIIESWINEDEEDE